jgi:hydrogenase expression/formation protein HypC
MCLGIPGKVVKVDGDVVTLDVMGTVRLARLDLLGEPVAVGEYVLHQLGFVTARLEEAEAMESLKLFEQVLSAQSG